MAASGGKMVGVSDDSSSSDDEALKRCQEAVWETRPDKKKDEDNNVQQSKRVIVAEHEHDGNGLQVTKGFQTHVAKKLGHLLDSCITEMQIETSLSVGSAQGDDNDEGFRLFSTSVPGQTAEESPAPVRRRPVPSSSDSDSEMETRLREAAVSAKDLLPQSLLPSTLPAPSAEPPCSEKIKKKKKKKKKKPTETETETEGEESRVVKKKKKNDSAGLPLNGQSNGENGNSEQEHGHVRVKWKKKKKRELNTED